MSTPMIRWFDVRPVVALALGAVLSTALGCERDASGLTEWTPADHDHQTEPRQRHNMQTQAQRNNPRAAPGKKDQVIDVTWMKQCATCHGRRGRGDGPSSTMVKARDLTNAEFQATLTDDQIATVIRHGKDKMPAFNLPDSIIAGLVQHVRGLVRSPSATTTKTSPNRATTTTLTRPRRRTRPPPRAARRLLQRRPLPPTRSHRRRPSRLERARRLPQRPRRRRRKLRRRRRRARRIPEPRGRCAA
jgi:cytochrome c oxidase cbb3-type subunit 3